MIWIRRCFRACGDAHEGSDWNLLLLLDKPEIWKDDFAIYSYLIMVVGFDMSQLFSILAKVRKIIDGKKVLMK